jgi:DNA-binding MarR family transcriptional regulator
LPRVWIFNLVPDSDSESSFHLPTQHGDVDAKLLAGLERLSQLFRGLLWERAHEHGLSPIQARVLLDLRYRVEEGRRVGALAEQFRLTAATVSDALTALSDKGLVEKTPDPDDRRARVVQLTETGTEAAEALSTWAEPVREQLRGLGAERKTEAMALLMDLISALEEADLISRTRMCRTCRFFDRDAHDDPDAPHHCNFLERPLSPGDLRMDCPEHEPADGAA